MELVGREYGNNYLGFKAAYKPESRYYSYYRNIKSGSSPSTVLFTIFSNIYSFSGSYGIDDAIWYDQYTHLTPFAQYAKAAFINILYEDNEEHREYFLKEISQLKNAGGYYFGMAIASVTELNETGQTDLDVFCEAYYNGCDLYVYKTEYNIKCSRQSNDII